MEKAQTNAATIISIDKQMLKEVQNLNRHMKKSSSFRMTFLRGIVGGVGTFLGATIVAGIVLASVSQVLDISRQVDIINKLVEQLEKNVDAENN
jgi:hypothetical protein